MRNNRISDLAEGLGPLSISGIADKISERKKRGEKIYKFTIGDFNTTHFPIPQLLEDEIIKAYRRKETNYPTVGGMQELRIAISNFIKRYGGFDYTANEIIAGSGARPLTYILFRTLINEGEKVINFVPSWNNYNYVYLAGAEEIKIETRAENNFMPTADELIPHLKDAALIALNSPSNPGGTAFTKEELKRIIDLTVEENKRRALINKKPLYIFYDMIYRLLTYGDTRHYNPVELNPGIRNFIIFIDGISKCFAATGVRVGWAFGPEDIINKMKAIIAHTGAWAPKPEQIGTARFLENEEEVDKFLDNFKSELKKRLDILYKAFQELKKDGYKVDAIEPQGAIYLTVKIDLRGMKTQSGMVLADVDDVLEYVLEDAKTALVPFYAFGAGKESPWFRISVGTCSVEDAKEAAAGLRNSLGRLSK